MVSRTIAFLSAVWLLAASVPSAYSFTNLVWSDEFNGPGTNIDTTKWNFDIGNSSSISGGGWGNAEKETYSSAAKNAFVSNGVLHIVALNDVGGGAPYSSARLQTLKKFSLTFGRVEVRAKLPAGSPYWWPAIWMLATNYSGSTGVTNSWPECGEIDMVESKGSTPTINLATLHKDSSGSPGNDSASGVSYSFPSGDANTNFHNYVMQWGSGFFNFTVDSNTVHYTPNNGTINSWSSSIGAFPTPFNHPFYLIMNLAVGGQFVGNPSTLTINSSTTFPGDMQIDYIRVYQDLGTQAPLLGVTSVSPTNACSNGGTVITISGTNFVAGATVTIGGTSAGFVTYMGPNALSVVAPSLSAGAKTVVVTNPDGTSASLVNAITYLSGPTSFAGLTSATAGLTSATLTWSAATGVAPFTYKVFQGTSSGGENFGSPVLTTSSLSAFFSPLSCTTTYYYVVRAIDACGNSDNNSVEHSAQPQSAPTVFSGLNSAAAAADGATLSWSVASGQSPITYSVFESGSSGGENYGSPLLTTTNQSVFIPSLSCSSTYYFVVRATGACGIGETNTVEQSVQPLPAPIVFSGLTSVTPAVGGATLTWSAASSGEPPISYNVFQASSSGGENFGSPLLTTSGLSTFIPSLSCSNTYYFVVRAVGGCGAANNNSVELSVQPLAIPTVFSGLSSVSAAVEGATLTWSSGSGQAPITYNVFEATTSGAENYGAPLLTTNSLSVFLAPLYPGSNSPITYFFVVRAQGACNTGESNTVEKSIQPLLDPNKSQVGDGIPNSWKQQYNFNPFDPSLATEDPDGDGVANLQEYLTGTDPTSSASYFHLISITPQGNDVLITWMCGGGRTNVVQSTYDLTVGYSAISSNIVLSGSGDSVTNYLDTGAGTNSQYLYRIQFVP